MMRLRPRQPIQMLPCPSTGMRLQRGAFRRQNHIRNMRQPPKKAQPQSGRAGFCPGLQQSVAVLLPCCHGSPRLSEAILNPQDREKSGPWSRLADNYHRGRRLVAAVQSIADFGSFLRVRRDAKSTMYSTAVGWQRARSWQDVKEKQRSPRSENSGIGDGAMEVRDPQQDSSLLAP
jgi:hypothetical protein